MFLQFTIAHNKYVLSTMGVSKESISKFLVGNRFHVKLRILSPYSNIYLNIYFKYLFQFEISIKYLFISNIYFIYFKYLFISNIYLNIYFKYLFQISI